ncbi:Acetyltransferase [Planctomycetales bacterium 10988]|nr:Acetyltransferase [Planctomycetales bacterium 10988]
MGTNPTIKRPTLGGLQFWSDERFFWDWRIQKSSFSEKYRLIDPQGILHQQGDWDACVAKLEEIKQQRLLPPMKGKVVLLLHGLIRTSNSMHRLKKTLEEQGYIALAMTYPSTQGTIDGFASSLHHIIEALGEEVTEINFVGHSMGNIVVRHYMADRLADESQTGLDPRIHRFVMIGPPNQGADLAKRLSGSPLSPAFRMLMGPAGQQLGSEWFDVSGSLAVPPCEFGIIAGGRGNGKGYSWVLSGDDDGIVTVEETKLPGAHDFIIMPILHTFMAAHKGAIERTANFLQHGSFTSEAKRHPLPDPLPDPAEESAKEQKSATENVPHSTKQEEAPSR